MTDERRAASNEQSRAQPSTASGCASRVRLALLIVLLLGVVVGAPISLVGERGESLRRLILADRFANVHARVAAAGPVLAFAPPVDSTISAAAAGTALHEMFTMIAETRSGTVPQREPAPFAPLPSLDAEDSPFRDIKSRESSLPDPEQILLRVGRGSALTALERAWLADIAEHPVWTQFELVARAPAIDVFGGRFELPFPATVTPNDLPITPFFPLRALTTANASRAAHMLAQGDRAGAERVLRQTAGVGRAMLDASWVIDRLTGSVTLRRAETALLAFYEATNDPRGPRLAAAADSASVVPVAPRAEPAPGSGTLEQQRLALIRDHTVAPSIRFEWLLGLGALRCTRISLMRSGLPAEFQETFDWAQDSVARYPSERAVLEMAEAYPASRASMPLEARARLSIRVRLLDAWGRLLRNRTMQGCARVLGDLRTR